MGIKGECVKSSTFFHWTYFHCVFYEKVYIILKLFLYLVIFKLAMSVAATGPSF